MTFDFPTILVLASAITGLIWLIDTIFFAARRQTQEPIIVEYARSFFPVIFIVLILRSFLIEPFRIPSGSMMPTLLVGDFILVNKYIYGLRLPVLNSKVVEINNPQRGDVVVFRFPQNPTIDYIKRVIGVPGDRIEYRNKTLYINDQIVSQTPIGLYTGIGSGTRETGSFHVMEHLNEVKHAILTHPLTPDLTSNCNFVPKTPIPSGKYFVMGDNRDNSNDSRCWGLVPEENLVGKAIAIWMNWDGANNRIIDWTRIGTLIR
jgi:signal peptidase I